MTFLSRLPAGLEILPSSPNTSLRLKVPVISHALETSLLHRVVAAEPSLIPDPMELNGCQLSTRLTSFDSLHWYMRADQRVPDPMS